MTEKREAQDLETYVDDVEAELKAVEAGIGLVK